MKLTILFSFLALLSASAFAVETQKYVRTQANQTANAELEFSKYIYRDEWRSNIICQDETYTEQEQYTEYDWVTRQEYECSANPDGTQNCNWVTKQSYEPVNKVRDVTKTRNVCRDYGNFEQVYDHTWAYNVEVIFPAEASLYPEETETLVFEMSGTERKPAVKLDQSGAVFHYTIAKTTFANGLLTVQLAATPYLKLNDVGAKRIGKVTIAFEDEFSLVTIEDSFSRVRVESEYKLVLTDRKTKAVLAESTEFTRQGKKLTAKLPVALDSGKDYVVTLEVVRSGPVLINSPIRFTVTKTVKAEELDMRKLKSSSRIGHFSLVGVQDKLVLRFQDDTPDYVTAQTNYQIEISMDDGRTPVASAEFARSILKTDRGDRFLISFRDDFKVDAALLASLVKNTKLDVSVVATRSSKRFSPEIVVKKAGSLKVRR